MKRTFPSIIWAIGLIGHAAFGQERPANQAAIEAATVSSAVTYQAALARADIAIAKSVLNGKLLKGEVGEAIRDQIFGGYLHRSGQWLNVSPRLGPQGLDHVSVQLNESGKPHRLMVDETKFGSSKLLITKSGDIQMGNKWVSDRLSGLAKRFDTIRAQAAFQSAKAPAGLASKRIVEVPLSDSESVRFWRPAKGAGPWHYDGPSDSLPKAISQLKSLSELFQAGADGRTDFRKRIFQVKIDGDVLKVNILDATEVDAVGGNLGKLPVKAKIELPLARTFWKSDVFQAKMVNELRRQMPYLDSAEARHLAKGIQATANTAEEALARSSFTRFATQGAAKAGVAGVLVAVPIEIATQLFSGAHVDWSRVADMGGLAAGSAAGGSLAGNFTSRVLMSKQVGSASAQTAKILGLKSASRFANVAGRAVGGGATASLFAYGGYGLGYYDLQTANRFAVAGVAGTGVGAALTVALGGTKAVAGSVLASTGVGVVVIGVTAAVIYGFQVYDEAQDNIRLDRTIGYLSQKQKFFIPDAQSNSAR